MWWNMLKNKIIEPKPSIAWIGLSEKTKINDMGYNAVTFKGNKWT